MAHIHASFNNTIVTLTDRKGNALSWATSGGSGFRVHVNLPHLLHRLRQSERVRQHKNMALRILKCSLKVRVRSRVRDPCLECCWLQNHEYYRCDTYSSQRLSSTEKTSRLIDGQLEKDHGKIFGSKLKLSRREGTDLFAKWRSSN